jgi:hypothetical protein
MKRDGKFDLKKEATSAALWLASAAVLALVFFAYLQPSFMLDLGSRFVMCF